MIKIDNTLVSEEILEKKFVCDLSSCKGACCIEGNSGAPLEKSELKKLEHSYQHIKQYMTDDGIKEVESNGTWTVDNDGDYETPLVKNKECVYAYYDKNKILKCSIETAFNKNKINFKKPISCELYPIRVNVIGNLSALNYHNWEICNSACILGEKLKVETYIFLKKGLIKKFGKSWYNKLQKVAKNYLKKIKNLK